jgi:hypothetical protein
MPAHDNALEIGVRGVVTFSLPNTHSINLMARSKRLANTNSKKEPRASRKTEWHFVRYIRSRGAAKKCGLMSTLEKEFERETPHSALYHSHIFIRRRYGVVALIGSKHPG